MKAAYGVEIPTTLEELLDRRHCALIVYDMQVGIIKQLQNGAEVVAQVKRLLYAARGCRLRVIHTRHLSMPKELMGAFQYRMAMAWQRVNDPAEVQPWFLRDAPGFPIVPELEPLASEAVFDKLTMSAFEGTPLALALRDCGVRSFVIAGVAMEIGIEPTCRHAADLGLVPVIVRDACGAGHQDAADRALASLEFLGDAVISDLDTVCAALNKQR